MEAVKVIGWVNVDAIEKVGKIVPTQDYYNCRYCLELINKQTAKNNNGLCECCKKNK